MKKKRSYSDSVHFYGIIWDIAALLVFMMIPVSICLHLNVWPEAKYILKGLLPVAMIFYPSAVIEVLTYTPLLGAGGTYLGFVTGNITNLKLPCGLNAMENAGVRANSEEGEVVSTIAIVHFIYRYYGNNSSRSACVFSLTSVYHGRGLAAYPGI